MKGEEYYYIHLDQCRWFGEKHKHYLSDDEEDKEKVFSRCPFEPLDLAEEYSSSSSSSNRMPS